MLCQQMGVWECAPKFLYTILYLYSLVHILEQPAVVCGFTVALLLFFCICAVFFCLIKSSC